MGKFPAMEELVGRVALSALDDFEYKGKTLREWADLVSSGKLVEVAHGPLEDLPMTNADKIRAMSDEELAAYLSDDDRCCPPKHPNCHKYVNNCSGCHLEWLQQPAEVPV